MCAYMHLCFHMLGIFTHTYAYGDIYVDVYVVGV